MYSDTGSSFFTGILSVSFFGATTSAGSIKCLARILFILCSISTGQPFLISKALTSSQYPVVTGSSEEPRRELYTGIDWNPGNELWSRTHVNMCTLSVWNTVRNGSSQMMNRLSLGSCRSRSFTYSHIRFTVCGRDSLVSPTRADRESLTLLASLLPVARAASKMAFLGHRCSLLCATAWMERTSRSNPC